MSGLLVAGTTSDAGKSIVTTALCRAIARRGVDVVPFKSQNMSNNSMVTAPSGPGEPHGEIGRAQWVQARAARVEPEVAMNPVLLKPGSDHRSHVVALGRPAGVLEASDFGAGRRHLADAAFGAFDDLRSRHEVVVAEGAGSPAEINLRAHDYVNMGLARHGDLPVVVVGDIDRGGVFAALHGTVALLEPEDQALVAGFVLNKFRGDVSLLAPALERITALTGRTFHGILPWDPHLWLDSEDALDLDGRRAADRDGALRVAVVRLPRISNFTDVDALGVEPGVDVVFASRPDELAGADLVVLPGTRSTIADLAWLRERGLDEAVLRHRAAGRPVLGVCGGAQMLGRLVVDVDGVEGPADSSVEGLGLLDLTTRFGSEKVLRLPVGSMWGHEVRGYEIHHGRLEVGGADELPGGATDGTVFATMWHGSLESDDFRRALLTRVGELVGRGFESSQESFAARREERLDRLGDLAEQHLDVDALLDLARRGAPAGLPVVPSGAVS